MAGPITVLCNGQRKIINGYYTAGCPSISDTQYCAYLYLDDGDYNWTASDSVSTWGGTLSIQAGYVYAKELHGNGNGAGSVQFEITNHGVGYLRVERGGYQIDINEGSFGTISGLWTGYHYYKAYSPNFPGQYWDGWVLIYNNQTRIISI